MKRFRFIHTLLASAALLFTFPVAHAQSQSVRQIQSVLTATFTSASGTAYTAGDSVGVSQVLTNVVDANGRIVKLDGVKVVDSAGQAQPFALYFFDGNAPSLTDNAAFAWGSSAANFIGQVVIDASDYETINSKSTADRGFLGSYLKLSNTSQNLSVCVVTKGTPTYGNGGTLKITFYFTY